MPELRVFTPEQLVPWPGLNPRRHFDETKLQELVESVRQRGIHQPVLVHLRDELPHWIVAGERRWRAATAAGADIPAIARIYTEDEALEIALIENLDRDDLTPIEEARGFQALLARPGMTQRKLAEKIGRAQPYISNRIRLLELPDVALQLVEAGKLSVSVARDHLLKFIVLPEPYRAGFFDALAEELAGEALDHYEPDEIISELARKRSRSLKGGGYGADVPAFNPRRHEKCDCGGPKIDLGGWRGKDPRCWNLAWWNAEQKRAKAEKRKREARAKERAPRAKGTIGDFPLVSPDTFYKRYGYEFSGDRKYEPVAHADGGFAGRHDGVSASCFDPSELDRESLVVVEGRWGHGHQLVSTDRAGVEAARKRFRAAYEQRLAEELPKRVRDDLQAVRSSTGRHEIATVVRTLLRFRDQSRLNDLARELGFKPKGEAWDVAPLNGLTVEQMLDVVHVAVLRAVTHNRSKVLLTADIVLDEMAAPHREALRALVPWEITPDPEDEDDEGFADPDDEEEPDDATCVECGCTDAAACEGGCTWLVVDREHGAGVCSSCATDEASAKALLGEAAVA